MKGLVSKISAAGFFFLLFSSSCRKDWLDAKPIQKQVTLNSLTDLQAILDNTTVFNTRQPYMADLGADEYYIVTDQFNTRVQHERNLYLWFPESTGPDYYAGSTIIGDWDYNYSAVFYANTALEQLEKINAQPADYAVRANIKGSALFYRAYAFYNLASIFCKAYEPSGNNDGPGIVLRLIPDINLPSVRATVQETYDQILSDLLQSKDLLPVTPLYKTRPSKAAAYAMFARVYLAMENYTQAGLYADSALQLNDALLDYNVLLNSTTPYPMPTYAMGNPEIIFHTHFSPLSLSPRLTGRGSVDSVLYRQYAVDDLRKELFFDSTIDRVIFMGSYNATNSNFSGLATDELYLISAECLARTNQKDAALNNLNKLLKMRWRNTIPFVPIDAGNAEEALEKILLERKKELCFRGIRWTDLRRLNRDNRFKKTIIRNVNNTNYELVPGDNKYVFPIPYYEIRYGTGGVQQNPR